jgi:hypothetical protein
MPRGERKGNKETKKPKAEKNKVKSGNTPSPLAASGFQANSTLTGKKPEKSGR